MKRRNSLWRDCTRFGGVYTLTTAVFYSLNGFMRTSAVQSSLEFLKGKQYFFLYLPSVEFFQFLCMAKFTSQLMFPIESYLGFSCFSDFANDEVSVINVLECVVDSKLLFAINDDVAFAVLEKLMLLLVVLIRSGMKSKLAIVIAFCCDANNDTLFMVN